MSKNKKNNNKRGRRKNTTGRKEQRRKRMTPVQVKALKLAISEDLHKDLTANAIYHKYAHLASKSTIYKHIREIKAEYEDIDTAIVEQLKGEVDINLTSLAKNETIDRLKHLINIQSKVSTAEKIITSLIEDINQPILEIGEQIPGTELIALPTDVALQRKARRDAIKDLIELTKIDVMIEDLMIAIQPPPTNDEFNKIRSEIKI